MTDAELVREVARPFAAGTGDYDAVLTCGTPRPPGTQTRWRFYYE